MFGHACWPNLRPYNSKKLEFRSKQCVFLGYSNLHKGYKCQDPAQGRVYISRDVVFDETIFPFASMHPNAGARLGAELSILPNILLNPSTNIGDVNVHDQPVSSPMSTNATCSSGGVVFVEKKSRRNNCEFWCKSQLQRAIFHVPPRVGSNIKSEADPLCLPPRLLRDPFLVHNRIRILVRSDL
jgi:hypothetical protein